MEALEAVLEFVLGYLLVANLGMLAAPFFEELHELYRRHR